MNLQMLGHAYLGDYESQFNCEIGERIRQKRKQRKLSLQKLGARLGVHRNTIYRWEYGSPPSLWMFLRLCDELDIPHTMMLPNHALHRGAVLRQLIHEQDLTSKDIQDERDPPLTAKEKRW